MRSHVPRVWTTTSFASAQSCWSRRFLYSRWGVDHLVSSRPPTGPIATGPTPEEPGATGCRGLLHDRCAVRLWRPPTQTKDSVGSCPAVWRSPPARNADVVEGERAAPPQGVVTARDYRQPAEPYPGQYATSLPRFAPASGAPPRHESEWPEVTLAACKYRFSDYYSTWQPVTDRLRCQRLARSTCHVPTAPCTPHLLCAVCYGLPRGKKPTS